MSWSQKSAVVQQPATVITTDKVEMFTLTQSISISSTDMKKVPMVSRGVTSLINEAVEIDSNSPSYHYTKLSELKINSWVAERPTSTRDRFNARSVGLWLPVLNVGHQPVANRN